MLNPRAYDTMTGAFAGLSMRHTEYKQKANFGFVNAPRTHLRARTGRNTTKLPLRMRQERW